MSFLTSKRMKVDLKVRKVIKANRDNLVQKVKQVKRRTRRAGKNGTVVSINPDTKMWQIDGKDTNIKAEPELLDKINIANVEGLENKLQEVEKSKIQLSTTLKRIRIQNC